MSEQPKRWKVRMTAVIDDELEIEAETEQEAIEAADQDWTFIEASQWQSTAEEISNE